MTALAAAACVTIGLLAGRAGHLIRERRSPSIKGAESRGVVLDEITLTDDPSDLAPYARAMELWNGNKPWPQAVIHDPGCRKMTAPAIPIVFDPMPGEPWWVADTGYLHPYVSCSCGAEARGRAADELEGSGP